MVEKWKVIPDFPNYEISNLGQIRNVRTGRLLKLTPGSGGYYGITLCHEGNYKRGIIHRLVAFAFVDGYFDGAHVNHKDGNKLNNKAKNLEWVTIQDNIAHAVSIGLIRKLKTTIVRRG